MDILFVNHIGSQMLSIQMTDQLVGNQIYNCV